MRNKFNELLAQFGEYWPDGALIALGEASAKGDDVGYVLALGHVERTKKQNDSICTQFRDAGEEGIKYLASVLSSDDVDSRKKAVDILGQMGSNYQEKSYVRTLLEERARVEPTNAVLRKIEFQLVQISWQCTSYLK